MSFKSQLSTIMQLSRPSPILRHETAQSAHGAGGKECTPQTLLGATMVFSEGACAAYYRYHRKS